MGRFVTHDIEHMNPNHPGKLRRSVSHHTQEGDGDIRGRRSTRCSSSIGRCTFRPPVSRASSTIIEDTIRTLFTIDLSHSSVDARSVAGNDVSPLCFFGRP